MTRLPLVKSLLVSAAALSVAGALPAAASVHDHHRDRHARVETRPTVLIREPGHHARQPVRTRTVVVHDVRTRTVVVRQPIIIKKTVIVRQPAQERIRTVYVREPVRTVYVRPQPVAVRYVTAPQVRTVTYSERLDWSGYQRSRAVSHVHRDYRHESSGGGHRWGWNWGNWHW